MGLSRIIVAVLISLMSLLHGCATTTDVGSPGAAPETETDVESVLEETIAAMSLRQRIGQRFMGWVPRDGISDENRRLLAEGEIGGFILYPWNYDSLESAKVLTSRLQDLAGASSHRIPLFLSADQEGGRVSAFRFSELTQLSAAFYMGLHEDPDFVEAAAYINGVQLRSIGINMNLAPVLDLYPNPDRSIIGDRSFGANEDAVSTLGRAYIRGMIKSGVIPVIKHFPGHGLSDIDSHGDLPVIESIESEVLQKHIKPFADAIEEGARVVMTAHLLFPSIDPDFPVTLSTVFIQEVLRQSYGFNGLIITDGLSMGALSKHYSLDDTLKRCFEVGIDVILVHSRYSVDELIESMVTMVESGEIDENQITDGLARVLREKIQSGIITLSESRL